TGNQYRKTITFSSFSLAMLAVFQQGQTSSKAVEKVFLHAFEQLDPKMKEMVLLQKQLLEKSASIPE
ncbi:hypothetical protein RZN22_19065, partial [Bacillaceae bacterium S4-13-58]